MSVPTWHDLAAKFEAGTLELASPPLSKREASQLRWKFHEWRRGLGIEQGTSLYSNIWRVEVVLEDYDEQVGTVIVRFQMPEVSKVSRILGQMLSGGEDLYPSEDH